MDNEKFNKKYFVVKSNNLVEGKIDENLSSVEYKLLIASLSKLKPNDKVLKPIEFSIKDFCDLFKIQKRGMYTYLKNTCDKLIKRTITIKIDENKAWKKFSWLHYIDYEYGQIILEFHPRLEPYLLFCRENKRYTKYLLENIIDMNSKYSIIMYELLKQYEKIKTRTFKVSELREILGIPDSKYKKFDNLRKKVLLISMNEINGLTDINITFEEIKEGRKINKLKYHVSKKSYDINTNQYSLVPKLKLISILNKKIFQRTGYVFSFKILNTYHRIIIIDLIKKFEKTGFSDVLIQYPNAFFKWHLDDLSKNYDLEKIEDY